MTVIERRTLGKLPDTAFGCLDLPAIDASIIQAFHELPDLTGMVSDALDLHGITGAVGSVDLTPNLPTRRVVGPALTVLNNRRTDDAATAVKNRDNRLGDIEAHNLARRGDVLVVQGVEGISSMGGIAAAIATRQGEAGVIVDGAVRDLESSRDLGLPIWARGATPITGKWRVETVGINVEVTICAIKVRPGDLVVADATGVCFIPNAVIADVLATAQAIAQDEDRRQKLIAAGTPITALAAGRK
jgi:4-hydroxy-4-methyl-2-oxoglutarate aldolase